MSSQGAGNGPLNTAVPQAKTYADPGRIPRWGETLAPERGSLWWRVLWIGGGLILILLLVWFLYQREMSVTPAGGRIGQGGPMPVGVAKAQAGDMPITLNALGTVTPLATVTVRPQVSGPIVKFDFQEGQIVKAGDVLAEIDPRPYQAALDEMKGTLAKDQAALANAITDVHRYQTLFAEKAISQQILATQQALVLQDQGTIVSDKANVETAALNLQYAKVTSPIAGRVGIRQVDLGNLVQAGQTNGIVVVTQLQPMSVVFSLPEDNVGQVAGRMNSGAKLQADAFDRAQTQQIASGTVSAVDSEIDPTTGTVKVRATFDNSDNALFPQQFVNIKLLVDTLHDQTLVPAAAIQRGSQGSFVYVVTPDKRVEMRGVTLGPANATNVSITKGLKPGDTVVVDGADRLTDDAKVTIPNSSTSIAAPSANTGSSEDDAIAAQRKARFEKMLKTLPPDQQAALRKMSPDDRRAWFRAHRGQFGHRRGGGGGGP